MKFFETKYRIVPGIHAGYAPQCKKWYWHLWLNLAPFQQFMKIEDAQRVIDHYSGFVVYHDYEPVVDEYSSWIKEK